MTLAALASKVASLEGRKVQVSVGNVREILGILSDLLFSDTEVMSVLLANGKRRSTRRKG